MDSAAEQIATNTIREKLYEADRECEKLDRECRTQKEWNRDLFHKQQELTVEMYKLKEENAELRRATGKYRDRTDSEIDRMMADRLWACSEAARKGHHEELEGRK